MCSDSVEPWYQRLMPTLSGSELLHSLSLRNEDFLETSPTDAGHRLTIL